MARIQEKKAHSDECLHQRLTAETEGGGEITEGERKGWREEGGRAEGGRADIEGCLHTASKRVREAEGEAQRWASRSGALELKCPGNPLQHRPGTSSASITLLYWEREKATGISQLAPLLGPPS